MNSAAGKRVLITGGAGFIGARIAAECAARGLFVRVIDLVRPSLDFPHEALVGSILDPYEISKAARGCDYVVHAAAALGVDRTEKHRLECLTINIQGTVNIFEAAVKERVGKILFTSSSEVYGDGLGGDFLEDSALNPKSNYAITKLVGEEYARAYHQSYGLDYAIVRLFSIYGERQAEKFVLPLFVEAVERGQAPRVFGDGAQVRSFCHVDDAARGVALALLSEKSSGQILNIGNPTEPVTIRALAERVIRLSGKNSKPETVAFGDSDRTAGREIYRRTPSIERARRLLDYEPKIGLDEGIGRMLAFRRASRASGVTVG